MPAPTTPTSARLTHRMRPVTVRSVGSPRRRSTHTHRHGPGADSRAVRNGLADGLHIHHDRAPSSRDIDWALLRRRTTAPAPASIASPTLAP